MDTGINILETSLGIRKNQMPFLRMIVGSLPRMEIDHENIPPKDGILKQNGWMDRRHGYR